MRVVNRAVGVFGFFLFLKASSVFPFPVFPVASCFVRRAQLPRSCRSCPGHQLLFEHRLNGEPMMSCLTWEAAPWGNAPHLTDGLACADQLQRRAAFHPAAKSNFFWKNPFRHGCAWQSSVTRRSLRPPPRSTPSPVRPRWPGRCASATDQWPVAAPGPPRIFFFSDAPCFNFCQILLPRVPAGLPLQQAATPLPPAARAPACSRAGRCCPKRCTPPLTVFARTTAGVTADGFAMLKPFPVAHFAIEQRHGQRAQTRGDFFLATALRFLRSTDPSALCTRGSAATTGSSCARTNCCIAGASCFHFLRPRPAAGQRLVFELDPQRAPMIFQAAQFAFPELALPAQFAPLLFRARGNPDGPATRARCPSR